MCHICVSYPFPYLEKEKRGRYGTQSFRSWLAVVLQMTQVQRDSLRRDILVQLGHNPERPPVFLTDTEASEVLRVKRSTLMVWRCVGRHEIPFTKLGREVYYRLADLVEFIDLNTQVCLHG